MKCSICKQRIATTFLEKLVGTYVRDAHGRKQPVCSACQKRLGSAEALRAEL